MTEEKLKPNNNDSLDDEMDDIPSEEGNQDIPISKTMQAKAVSNLKENSQS